MNAGFWYKIKWCKNNRTRCFEDEHVFFTESYSEEKYKKLGIDWQIDISKAIISEKDRKLLTFKEFEANNDFVYGEE